jgi:hypothetical protein
METREKIVPSSGATLLLHDFVNCYGLMIAYLIIIAIAVANGFRFQIAEKARGFAADIVLTTPGEDIINTVNPINADLSYKSKIEELPFVENVFPVSYK